MAVAAPGSPKAGGLWPEEAYRGGVRTSGGSGTGFFTCGGALEERESIGAGVQGVLVELSRGGDGSDGVGRDGVGRVRSGTNWARSGSAGRDVPEDVGVQRELWKPGFGAGGDGLMGQEARKGRLCLLSVLRGGDC